MPVTARRLLRKMRGGAQAHLMEADDGHFYVVKFHNNPQHRRILVNELIASVFLRYLEIAAPPAEVVELTGEFLAANPEVSIQLGGQQIPVPPGRHFGSRYPGHPERLAVYDFIPDLLLEKVINLHDFSAVLVFDKWAGNADTRQAVFFRSRVREWVPGEDRPVRHGFLAQMIDHGFLFNGPHWDFVESPRAGLYFRPIVYRRIRSWEDFEPWLQRVVHFPVEVVDDAFRRIPPEWLTGDEDALERLLERLLRRSKTVPELLRQTAQALPAFFPNWRAG